MDDVVYVPTVISKVLWSLWLEMCIDWFKLITGYYMWPVAIFIGNISHSMSQKLSTALTSSLKGAFFYKNCPTLGEKGNL